MRSNPYDALLWYSTACDSRALSRYCYLDPNLWQPEFALCVFLFHTGLETANSEVYKRSLGTRPACFVLYIHKVKLII